MGRIEILKKHIQECEEVYKRRDIKECAKKIEEINKIYGSEIYKNEKEAIKALYRLKQAPRGVIGFFYDKESPLEGNINQLKILIGKMEFYLAELEDEERKISLSSINSSNPQVNINNINNNTQTMNLNINIEDVIKSLDNIQLDKELKEIIEDRLRSLESLKDNKPKLKEKITNILKFLCEKTTEASINALIPTLLPYLAKFFQ